MKSIPVKIYSNRSFGILFFIVFLAISLWPLISQEDLKLWALILSLIFLILGALNSKALTPLNIAWIKFGNFLGNIVSPVVMGVIFFMVITPIGLIMRLLGKDLLKVKKGESMLTYWIEREKKTDTMKRQF